jgi:hypothetical protein
VIAEEHFGMRKIAAYLKVIIRLQYKVLLRQIKTTDTMNLAAVGAVRLGNT